MTFADAPVPDDIAEAAGAPRYPGRVARVDRDSCELLTAQGAVRARYGAAVRRAALTDRRSTACVGDWVAAHTLPDGQVEVDEILPRRTEVVRDSAAADSAGQVLAANVDVVLVVEPAVPGISLGRIERLLALAWASGARPLVVITKADLAEIDLEAVAAVAPGAQVVAVSAATGVGLEDLELAPGETAVLLGRSGAGKSTLVNALAGRDVMTVQAVRAADGRGRHTTVHRELLPLRSGAMIIDTPGLRSIGLSQPDGVEQVFEEIQALAQDCRFADCTHGVEPGCAVLDAVAQGTLPARRLESWRRLQREQAYAARRVDARLRAEEARRWKTISKAARRLSRP